MVEIHNDITEEPCELYGPDNKIIGTIKNVFSFLDARIQIKENELKGYYIKFRNEIYMIDSKGELYWPEGLFDKFSELSVKLI